MPKQADPVKAKLFALKCHGDQRYGKVAPYYVHLQSVSCLVAQYGPQYEVVAWLHDTVEDTCEPAHRPEFLRHISKEFGDTTSRAVHLLTNEISVDGSSDVRATHQKILEARESDGYDYALTLACTVKVADRLSNMMASAAMWDAKSMVRLSRYLEEWPQFRLTYFPSALDTMYKRLAQFVRELKEQKPCPGCGNLCQSQTEDTDPWGIDGVLFEPRNGGMPYLYCSECDPELRAVRP